MAKRKWSYGTYGKTALSSSISLTGFDELLARVEKRAGSLDAAVREALERSSEVIKADMMAGAMRHEKTGAVVDAIYNSPVQLSGNTYSVDVGIDFKKHPKAIHAVFQEYGAPTFPADPFIRPAFDKNKAKVKSIQKQIIAKHIGGGK